MGLDNGIEIRGKTPEGIAFLHDYCEYMIDKYAITPGTYEIAYWRKCWNIRARFGETIGYNNGDYTSLTLADLSTFVEEVLKYFLEEKNWRETGSSIWEWDTMIRQIGDQIYNTRRLLNEIEMYNEDAEKPLTDEDFEIIFYDSY